MEEQKELDDLKRLMTEQQSKLSNTMAEMELKASTLQEKLDKKSELSKSNANAGVRKVALEYKIVELEVKWTVPTGFTFGFGKPEFIKQFKKSFGESFGSTVHGRGHTSPQFSAAANVVSAFGAPTRASPSFDFGATVLQPVVPDPTSKEFEDQAVMKDIKVESRKQLRKFETTTLKELGEDGWTLRSVHEVHLEPDMTGTTYVYYFSRPL